MDLPCPFLWILDQQKQVFQVSPARYLNMLCSPSHARLPLHDWTHRICVCDTAHGLLNTMSCI